MSFSPAAMCDGMFTVCQLSEEPLCFTSMTGERTTLFCPLPLYLSELPSLSEAETVEVGSFGTSLLFLSCWSPLRSHYTGSSFQLNASLADSVHGPWQWQVEPSHALQKPADRRNPQLCSFFFFFFPMKQGNIQFKFCQKEKEALGLNS